MHYGTDLTASHVQSVSAAFSVCCVVIMRAHGLLPLHESSLTCVKCPCAEYIWFKSYTSSSTFCLLCLSLGTLPGHSCLVQTKVYYSGCYLNEADCEMLT
jgi:hypothetical protein